MKNCWCLGLAAAPLALVSLSRALDRVRTRHDSELVSIFCPSMSRSWTGRAAQFWIWERAISPCSSAERHERSSAPSGFR